MMSLTLPFYTLHVNCPIGKYTMTLARDIIIIIYLVVLN